MSCMEWGERCFPKKKGAWAGGVHEPREEQLLVFPLCVIEQQRALTNQDNPL